MRSQQHKLNNTTHNTNNTHIVNEAAIPSKTHHIHLLVKHLLHRWNEMVMVAIGALTETAVTPETTLLVCNFNPVNVAIQPYITSSYK